MNPIEALVLHSIIAYPQNVALFFQVIKKEYLSERAQEVYVVLWEAFTNNITLEKEYIFAKLSLPVKNMLLSQIPTKHITQYYEFIIEDFNLKNRIALIEKLKSVVNDSKVDLSTIFQEFIPKTATRYMTLAQRLEHIASNDIKFDKHEMGVNFLDIVLHGGIELHKLVLISGEYESGKTSLCLQILRNLATSHKCAYFCFEFPADKYALDEEKNLQKLVNKKELHHRHLPAIKDNIYIIDEGMNVDDVVANILFLASMGVKFFVIDSQMRLNVEQALNVEESESRKFEALTTLCNKYGITIFLIVQTSKNDTKSPLGSKKGGHEASIMIRIEHNKSKDNSTPFDPDSRTVIIQKNKQTGKHAKFHVRFDTDTQTFHSDDIVDYEDYTKKGGKKIEVETISLADFENELPVL